MDNKNFGTPIQNTEEKKRPIGITLISILFILAAIGGGIYFLTVTFLSPFALIMGSDKIAVLLTVLFPLISSILLFISAIGLLIMRSWGLALFLTFAGIVATEEIFTLFPHITISNLVYILILSAVLSLISFYLLKNKDKLGYNVSVSIPLIIGIIIGIAFGVGGLIGVNKNSSSQTDLVSELQKPYSTSTISEWKEYDNSKYGYKISYPSSWEVEENANYLKMYDPADGDLHGTIEIYQYKNYLSATATITDYGNENIAANLFGGFTDITIDNEPAIRYSGEIGITAQTNVNVAKGRDLYGIHSIEKSGYNKYSNVLDQMATTFKFIQ